jgi:hypothetical protein
MRRALSRRITARSAAGARAFSDATATHAASWEGALASLTVRIQDPSRPLPTTPELVRLTNGILNRHVSSAAMAAAVTNTVHSEQHVPLAVVVSLARLAADIKRVEYIKDGIAAGAARPESDAVAESASASISIARDIAQEETEEEREAAADLARTREDMLDISGRDDLGFIDGTARGRVRNIYGVRNYDHLFAVFDSAMRHVALSVQRMGRQSTYHYGLPPPRKEDEATWGKANRSPAEYNASRDDVLAREKAPMRVATNSDLGMERTTHWEAAIAVMSYAHYCGVLQHEYDGPGEDVRIFGTARIWRNFGTVMASEVVGDAPGRAAWANALTLLTYLTPVPTRDAPPCCGFTRPDDEIAMVKATEEALGRADRRDDLLTYQRYVRCQDVRVSRHVCRSKEVAALAKAKLDAADEAVGISKLTQRGNWGLELDVKGDACVVNLLKTVAPNAVPASVAADAPLFATVRSGPFLDREWRRSTKELDAIDAALSSSAASSTPQ